MLGSSVYGTFQARILGWHKNKLKMDQIAKCETSTIKLLEENIGRTLTNHSNIFFDPSPRIMEIRTKINKWDLLKLSNFCTARETVNKRWRQLTDWEKIFANNMTDKGLVSNIYKHLSDALHHQNKKSTQKMGRRSMHFVRSWVPIDRHPVSRVDGCRPQVIQRTQGMVITNRLPTVLLYSIWTPSREVSITASLELLLGKSWSL